MASNVHEFVSNLKVIPNDSQNYIIPRTVGQCLDFKSQKDAVPTKLQRTRWRARPLTRINILILSIYGKSIFGQLTLFLVEEVNPTFKDSFVTLQEKLRW